jgi:hypothetical protein
MRMISKLFIIIASLCVLSLPGFADDAWKFAVIGDTRGNDSGVNAEILQELVSAIRDEKPAFVIVVGDLVNGRTDYNELKNQLLYWRQLCMEPLMAAGIRVYPVRGNHDVPTDNTGAQAWNEVFVSTCALPPNGPAFERNVTYSFFYRNAFFALMDLYAEGREHNVNQQWLDEQFQSNYLPHVFVFAHEPAYGLGGAGHSDGLHSRRADRDRFVQSIVNEGGRAYFCGHDHLYDHGRVPQGSGLWFHQFIVGNGGAPASTPVASYAESTVERMFQTTAYGYEVIEISGDRVTATMKTRSAPGVYTAVENYSMVAAPQPEDAALRVFPNPYCPARHTQGMIIKDIIAGGTIKIYTLSGELIYEAEDTDGDGMTQWFGKNSSGQEWAFSWRTSKKPLASFKVPVLYPVTTRDGMPTVRAMTAMAEAK